VAPPLLRGPARVRQRLAGLLFLLVLTALVALAVAMYAKAFTPVVEVVLQAERAGNQLAAGADVKARGVLVGEVRGTTSSGSGAEVRLALEPDAAARIPSDTRAELLPKTLFGEKFVALVFDDASTAPPLTAGDVIGQDRSETARATRQALDDLLPLLQTLRPQRVSTTLNALSSSLRGRGDRIGENLVLTGDWLAAFNPELPVLAEDLRGTADLADTLHAGADDLMSVLDDLSVVNRSLVDSEQSLSRFLSATSGAAGTTRGFVTDNERRLVDLARESVPHLRVYERYAPGFPCLLAGIAGVNAEGERVFGGAQPGLHITAEVTQDLGGYRPGQEPVYADDAGPTCFGLDGEPVRPFPTYRNPDDGYRDGEEVDPWTGQPPGESRSTSASRTPLGLPDVAALLVVPLTG
jgi:phospholipid/cholesterol/gamma-HCH transport system substrate-binding protein